MMYDSAGSEFVDPSTLKSKGYDNSGANDEEVDIDQEYSDDEEEAQVLCPNRRPFTPNLL
jgi:hypothetical protein